MRPTPIPEEEVWPGTTRIAIAPPGGDWFDPEVSGVEALFEEGESRVNRFSVRLMPEDDDLARLNRGDPLWLTVNSPQMPVFSTHFAVTSMPTGRCRNCGKSLVAIGEEVPPESMVFHERPGDDPPCSMPEVEWVEVNPPNLTDSTSEVTTRTVLAIIQQAVQEATEHLSPGRRTGMFQVQAGRVHERYLWGQGGLQEAAGRTVLILMAIAADAGFDLWSSVEDEAESMLAEGAID